ncbi:hypothetical protein [Desulfogranum japonicum]|uniref:hypothetical protein n=1 Tax=Desulfogranum japonicum TaxID=231447 RepID=UPI000411EDC0|nr:hypothetical protein [Desulfogranum japonicum]
MKGKIADSIIIKVGQGIMRIPRKIQQSGEGDISHSFEIQHNRPKTDLTSYKPDSDNK